MLCCPELTSRMYVCNDCSTPFQKVSRYYTPGTAIDDALGKYGHVRLRAVLMSAPGFVSFASPIQHREQLSSSLWNMFERIKHRGSYFWPWW